MNPWFKSRCRLHLRGKPGGPPMSHRLRADLAAKLGYCEVVDLSAGGQDSLEGLLVLLGSGETVRPDAVVTGVSIFSAQGTSVREPILAVFPPSLLRERIQAAHPPEVSGRRRPNSF